MAVAGADLVGEQAGVGGEHVSDMKGGRHPGLASRAAAQLSSPVGTFLFSDLSFMPAASAMVSISAAKSFLQVFLGVRL